MNPVSSAARFQLRRWVVLVMILIGLGMVFRVTNLDQAVYWVDEVATSMRVSGYTQAEVTQQLLAQQQRTGQPLTTSDLLHFQEVRSDRSWTDLGRVLALSPEHAPLYFILARGWAALFGSSVLAMRSLPVLFSWLALPTMYWSCRQLFATADPPGAPMAWTATGLLAISPFFVAYAQEARPYSLWILLLLLLNGFLWRSLQSNQPRAWLGYGLALVLGCYSSLLTLLVVMGQGLAVMGFQRQRLQPYLWTTSLGLLLFTPWLWIVVSQWATLQGNTTWMAVSMPLWSIIGVWFYSLAVLFFDVTPAIAQPLMLLVQALIALATVALIVYAVCLLARRASLALSSFLLAGALAIPALLLLLDLLRDGQAAATPRYLMPTHLGVVMMVAYALGGRLFSPVKLWRIVTTFLVSVSLVSCLFGLSQDSIYQKSRNLSNPAITALLNQTRSPQLVATTDQIQDLISLSYRLDAEISIYILPAESEEGIAQPVGSPVVSPETALLVTRPVPHEPQSLSVRLVELLEQLHEGGRPVFLFEPTELIKAAVEARQTMVLTTAFESDNIFFGDYGLTVLQLDRRELSERG